jgi:hypothetical protein
LNYKLLLRVATFLSLLFLIGNAILIRRDFQDSWILEGLEIPFILFVLFFSISFFSEKKTSYIVAMAIVGRIVFSLIPNLKYVWFQGVFMDQHTQFYLSNYIVNNGGIAQIGTGSSSAYISSPLFHILFSVFSLSTNLSVVEAMKFVPIFLSPIYPLAVYIILKSMEFGGKEVVLKYALFISAIPIVSYQYVVTGTTFGMVLALLVLSVLAILLQKNNSSLLLLCIVFVLALAASHSVTSIIFTVLFLGVNLLNRFPGFRPKKYFQVSLIILIVLVALIWLAFVSYGTLEEISRQLFFAVPTGATPSSEYVPSTFFNLLSTSVIAALRTFLVYYGSDLFLVLLTFLGLLILVRKRKSLGNVENFLFLFCGLSLVIILFGVFAKLGATRTLVFIEILGPIFAGFTLFFIGRSRLLKWAPPVILGTLIILSTVGVYLCQPLIPSANILYKDLSNDVPLGYVNEVNTVYQRQLVSFILNNPINGRIAADGVTYYQIFGVASYDFQVNHLTDYYPLDPLQTSKQYAFFAIHIPGRAGVFVEAAKIRSSDIIIEDIYSSSIFYSNGESYLLSKSYS